MIHVNKYLLPPHKEPNYKRNEKKEERNCEIEIFKCRIKTGHPF